MVAPSKQTVFRGASIATLFTPLVLAASPNWTLSTSELNRTAWQRQPYVANGYLSQRIPAEGFGYRAVEPVLIDGDKSQGTNGWPLFDPRFTAAMVAGFYDSQPNTTGTNFPQTGGEQPISTLPTWSSLYLTVNNETFDISTQNSQISNWTQSQSIQDGVVQTSLDWKLQDSNQSINLKYTLFAHRVEANLGVVRLDVSGLSNDSAVAVTDVLDGIGAWRTDFVESGISSNSTNTIYTAVRPHGISNVTAYETSVLDFLDSAFSVSLDNGTSCYPSLSTNASTISQCYRLSSIPSSGSISVVKYVGIASSDAFNGTERSTSLKTAQRANSTGYSSLLSSHQSAWNEIWNSSDIVIPQSGLEEVQYATRASLFHLISNVRQGNESMGLGDNSIAPAGLTSDSYAGQIFWDADTWMHPSLLVMAPEYSESIVDFRHRQLGAALENANKNNFSGALYPWTAARFGNCTGVGPCVDYEYHLNADIALAVYDYYASTQNRTWLEEKGWPIVEAVSNMFAGFVQYDNGKYSTYNETSPDEYSNHKNNSAMTNGAIAVTLRNAQALASILGKDTPANWTDIANNITILVDPSSNILLEFDGFNGTTAVKQADVVLLTYPYQYNQSKTQGLLDLDYYSLATSPNGPGMTRSIFSIDAAELSPVGCATWSHFLGSAQPYSRLPFYQFSEQTIDVYAENGGTNPAFTFLTGHGGFLQALTHGFTGFRSRLDRMYFDPLLPPQLDEYTLKGFKWGGSSFDIHLTTKNTTITHKSYGEGDNGNSTVKIEIASRNAKAGNYSLSPGETLTVPTFTTNGTLIEGNLAQCARVLSNDTSFQNPNEYIVPGEYALSAVDGANATYWQPVSPAPATLSIDLSESKNISGMHINWGFAPPLNYTVLAGDSIDNMTALVSSASIDISSPYDASTANAVAIKVGNLTDVRLNTTVVARYVNLTIEGSRDGTTSGGTVAEFAVL